MLRGQSSIFSSQNLPVKPVAQTQLGGSEAEDPGRQVA